MLMGFDIGHWLWVVAGRAETEQPLCQDSLNSVTSDSCIQLYFSLVLSSKRTECSTFARSSTRHDFREATLVSPSLNFIAF